MYNFGQIALNILNSMILQIHFTSQYMYEYHSAANACMNRIQDILRNTSVMKYI